MGNEESNCGHDLIQMCDPCCVCSKLIISELQSKLSELEKERDSLLSSRVESQPFYYKEWEKIKARNAELGKDLKRNNALAYDGTIYLQEKIKDLEQKLFLKDQVLDADEKRVYELEQKLAQVTQEKEVSFEQMKPLVNLIVSIQTWAKVHEKVEIRRLCDETLSNFRKVSEEKP